MTVTPLRNDMMSFVSPRIVLSSYDVASGTVEMFKTRTMKRLRIEDATTIVYTHRTSRKTCPIVSLTAKASRVTVDNWCGLTGKCV